MNGNTQGNTQIVAVSLYSYSIVRRPGAENSDWIGSAPGSRTEVELDCLRMASPPTEETRHETRGGPASLAEIQMTRWR